MAREPDLNGNTAQKWSQDTPGIVGESGVRRLLSAGRWRLATSTATAETTWRSVCPTKTLTYLDEAVFAGGVNVIYGSAAGLTANCNQFWSQISPGILGEPDPDPIDFKAFEKFGSSLAVGDFNNDGRDDLAIGVPGDWVGGIDDAGAVNVIYGSFRRAVRFVQSTLDAGQSPALKA